MNAVVMDEAEIGAQAMVAACAFVPGGMRVAPRSLVAGVPARMVRALNDDEVARKLEGTRAYQELTVRCLASLQETRPLASIEPGRPQPPVTKADALMASRDRRTRS
jgi:phenylacetic acid degradation protein